MAVAPAPRRRRSSVVEPATDTTRRTRQTTVKEAETVSPAADSNGFKTEVATKNKVVVSALISKLDHTTATHADVLNGVYPVAERLRKAGAKIMGDFHLLGVESGSLSIVVSDCGKRLIYTWEA